MSGDFYQPSDAVIEAARALREALFRDHGLENNERGIQWMARNFFGVLVLCSQMTSEQRGASDSLLSSVTDPDEGGTPS